MNNKEVHSLSLRKIIIRIFLLFLVIAFLTCLFSCGTRKVDKTKTDFKESVNNTEKGNINTETETSIDLAQFLSNFDVSVASKGTPYQFNYNGITFSGDADLKISKKSETTKIKLITRKKYIYQYHTLYQTQTQYKSKVNNTESSKPTFWSYFAVALIFFVLGFIAKYKTSW